MVYRDGVDALREREAALARELAAIEEAAARRPHVERELVEVRRAIGERRPAERAALHALRAPAIPLPCDVPWGAMRGDDRVRFCSRCAKNVYNLSAMTRTEAAAILARDDTPCVRYYERPDGTVLTSDCPVGAKKRRRRRAIAGLAGAAAFGAMAAAAVPAPSVTLVSVDRLARDVGERRRVRAEGALVHGSIDTRPNDVRFALESRGVVVPVRYIGGPILPDTFRDDLDTPVGVLVEGELLADGTFIASSLLAKVPSGARYAERPPVVRPGTKRAE